MMDDGYGFEMWYCPHCETNIEHYRVYCHACQLGTGKMKHYLVGIMPKGNPDPEYWLSRFSFVPASSEQEAIDRWAHIRQIWFAINESKAHARVWWTGHLTSEEPTLSIDPPSIWFQKHPDIHNKIVEAAK